MSLYIDRCHTTTDVISHPMKDDDDDDENVGDSGEGHDEKKTPAADQNSRYVYACVPNSVNR